MQKKFGSEWLGCHCTCGKKKFFKMVGDVCGGFVAMDMDTMETPSAMG